MTMLAVSRKQSSLPNSGILHPSFKTTSSSCTNDNETSHAGSKTVGVRRWYRGYLAWKEPYSGFLSPGPAGTSATVALIARRYRCNLKSSGHETKQAERGTSVCVRARASVPWNLDYAFQGWRAAGSAFRSRPCHPRHPSVNPVVCAAR